jgi:hypothetical protein
MVVLLGNLAIRVAAALFQVPSDVFLSIAPMVAPMPKSPAEFGHRKAVNEILADSSPVWKLHSGYIDPDEEEDDYFFINDDKRPKNLTYGEITPLGARQLFHEMGMTGSLDDSDPDKDEIVFVDMGSGVGRLVMQAYMELPRLKRAVGIEILSHRHQHAVLLVRHLTDTCNT